MVLEREKVMGGWLYCPIFKKNYVNLDEGNTGLWFYHQ